jgi:hypothetical protein
MLAIGKASLLQRREMSRRGCVHSDASAHSAFCPFNVFCDTGSIAHCDFGGVPYSSGMFARAEPKPARPPQRQMLVTLLAMVSASAVLLQHAVASETAAKPSVIIVVGAGGEEEFGRNFAQWAASWEKACDLAGAARVTIGPTTNSTASDREQLQQTLAGEGRDGANELWLVLLGHGTFDGKEAKFNLRGPDLGAAELADWLKPIHRPVAVIDAASASAPFMNRLSATNRVIVTATRSGAEVNYARFGQFFSQAVADPAADLDKDGQTSLLEAFLAASRRVAEFYSTEGRMVTEHALLDDNGDGLGTPADWFRGIRAVKAAKDGAPLDGFRAHQFHLVRSETERQLPTEVRARRDELELAIAKLRETKSRLAADEYYQKLEALLLEMARLYETGAKPNP